MVSRPGGWTDTTGADSGGIRLQWQVHFAAPQNAPQASFSSGGGRGVEPQSIHPVSAVGLFSEGWPYRRPLPEPSSEADSEEGRAGIASLVDGARALASNWVVVTVAVASVVTTMIITIQAPLIYVFIDEYLGGPDVVASRAGLLFSLAGIGGIIGGVVLAALGHRFKPVILFGCVLILDAILFAVFTLSSVFVVSVIAFSLLGIILTVNVALTDTLIQTGVPERHLGKAFGLLDAVTGPVGVLSLMIGGVAATAVGVRAVFLGCVVVEAALAIVILLIGRRKE